MFLDDDVVRNGQAEPGALANRFGGEKRLENSLQNLCAHPLAGIFDFKPDNPILDTGTYKNLAFLCNGLRRIDPAILNSKFDEVNGRGQGPQGMGFIADGPCVR